MQLMSVNGTAYTVLFVLATVIGVSLLAISIYKMLAGMFNDSIDPMESDSKTSLLVHIRELLTMRQIDETAFVYAMNTHYAKKYGQPPVHTLEEFSMGQLQEWHDRYKYGGGVSREVVNRMKTEGVSKVTHEEMPIVITPPPVEGTDGN